MAFYLKDQLGKLQERLTFCDDNCFAEYAVARKPILEDASQNVRALLGNVVPREPNKENLATCYDTILFVYNNDNGFDKLKKRYVRLSPWLLFKAIDESRPPLISNKSIAAELLRHITTLQDDKAILNLAFVMLRLYPQYLDLFETLNQLIDSLIPSLKKQRGQRFAQKAKSNNLFNSSGPKTVATKLIDNPKDVSVLLDEIGLHGGCQEEGFVEEVYSEWVEKLSQRLTTGIYGSYKESLSRLLNYSVHGNTLRFPQKRNKLVEGLLLPFQGLNPAKECKKYLRDFIIKYIGDPRFEPGRWTGVNEAARRVMLAWLSEIVLEDFFKLLDHSALYDTDADRQWKYRKTFWETCLRHGLIDNAWVALGKKVAQKAHLFLEQGHNTYAEISGSGVQGHHAVLILQLRNIIVTEWSHSGKYRFWAETSRDAPKLYNFSYIRDDVIHRPEFDGAHHGANRGTWQTTVADYIKSQIGYKLPFNEYMNI